MTRIITLILFFIYMLYQVKAQSSSPNQENLVSNDVTSFQPSLAVVVGILAIMFSLTFILLVYAKFCHRVNPINNNHQTTLDGLIRSGSRFSGVDKTVIESLPFFRFSLLKGSKEGLECAVCLSRFEDVEILRLLPKCKHAFHIDCVDQWLEKHSSCPLCRQKVSIDDLSLLTYSNSLRFLWNPSELREDSNIELFVQREESHKGSSRFSIGNSSRKFEKGKKEEELPFQESCEDDDEENGKNMLHKFNHKILVSDFVFKNRWSNVSSSDLMFLNSEMINSVSSDRFSSLGLNKIDSEVRQISQKFTRSQEAEEGGSMNIREEMERKREFESKVSKMKTFGSTTNENYGSKILNSSEKRSMSEITIHSRLKDLNINSGVRESNILENDTKEEKMKRVWYPIARRTAQWFANREKRSPQSRSQTLHV